MLTRKLLATAALSTLAIGALAGCATSTKAGPATPAAPDQMTKLVSDVTGTLQKVASSTDTVTSLAFTMTGKAEGGVEVTGTGSMAFQPLQAEFDVNGGDQTTTLRVVNNTIYVKVPADQRAEMKGKTWLKLSSGPNGPFGDVSRQFQDVNPIEQVKTLLASGKAVAVGQETVDGVPTVHYKATTPVETVLKAADPKYKSMLKGVYDKAGVKEVTTEVWVDAQYRPHRMHVVTGTLSDVTVDYHDYNTPVKVTAPAASDTFDMSDFLKTFGH